MKAGNVQEALRGGILNTLAVQAHTLGTEIVDAELVTKFTPHLSENDRSVVQSFAQEALDAAIILRNLPAGQPIPLEIFHEIPDAIVGDLEGSRISSTVEVEIDRGDGSDPFLITVVIGADGTENIGDLIEEAVNEALGVVGLYSDKFGVEPGQVVTPVSVTFLNGLRGY